MGASARSARLRPLAASALVAKEGAIRMGSGTAPAIRPATAADAQRLADIYNQAIAERGATFETTPRTAADMARRLAEAAAEDAGRHPSPPSQPPQPPQLPKPLLVVEHADAVAGWAAISSYSQRRCYAGVGDFSIYLDRAARGRGLGRLLLEALIGEAARLGYWKLVSGIFPFNAASRALCRACGFREVGTYQKHSRLDGRWLDVVIVERLIPENQRS
jgi:L-amino acid N-acyltransferase YncA